MLQGYRTYISIIAMFIYNLAASLGVTEVSSQEFQNAIDVIVNFVLGLLALYFRAKAQPKPTA